MLRYRLTHDQPLRPTHLQFGVLSADEIEQMSVCCINDTTLYYRGLPSTGGLLDPRMGTVDRRHLCATCMRNAHTCQGHVGHIRLAYPMYHIGFVDTILRILRVVCFGCSRICIDPDTRRSIISLPESARLTALVALIKNRRVCNECMMPRPGYAKTNQGTIGISWSHVVEDAWESDEERAHCHQPFTAREALSILSNLIDKDILLMGFHVETSHPKNMVLQNLLVPPPCTRPAIYSSEGSRSRGQNELTLRYMEIMKRNVDICNAAGGSWVDVKLTPEMLDRISRLQYEVFILISNTGRIARPPGMGRGGGGASQASQKSITDRIKGKEGRVRGNLMGKRVDFSARCVITPDAYFDCDRVGVPYHIAKSLTIPEKVNQTNIKSLTKRIQIGSENVCGAQTILFRDGRTTDLSACKNRTDIKLNQGDVVERFLEDDDIVVFNRQPSLHMHGMQAHRVSLMPGHTFRLSLPVATPYNADFDGDEMNIHVPQSKAATAECAMLMAVSQNLISAQANRPVMGTVQDTLLANYVLTNQDVIFDHAHACRLICQTKFCSRSLRPAALVVVRRGLPKKSLWTGKQMFSALLPPNLHINPVFSSSSVDWLDEHLPVYIKDSELLTGILTKQHVGSTAGGIIDIMCREMGNVVSMRFMGDNQRMMHAYLLQKGHAVGIVDVMLSKSGHERVAERLEKASSICEEIQRDIIDATAQKRHDAEDMILRILSKMLLQTGGIVEEEMSSKNAIRQMVKSGSKGSFINLSQIAACLGQQSLEGRRMQAEKESRTLPCFRHDDISLESKGMVFNSFSLGLNAPELFYHAIGGREGLVDTAVKTSQTGYLQRRMNKSMEDHTVHSDHTIRNSNGDIICFRWGTDGMHPCRIQRLKFGPLTESIECLKARIRVQWLQHFLKIRFKIIQARTHPLCPEFDEYALLPFNPARMKEDIRRRVMAVVVGGYDGGRASGGKVDVVIENLFSLTKSAVVHLAILDVLDSPTIVNLSEELLRSVHEQLQFCINNAHAVVGESAGCVSAQSVGEPATQMTLNTFHTAGVAMKNVTLGLPRLKELIDASKTAKTPCTMLRLLPRYRTSRNYVRYISDTLPLVRLNDIVCECEVRMDPDPLATCIENDKWMVDAWATLHSHRGVADDYALNVIRLSLDRELMHIRKITPPMVRSVIRRRLQDRAIVISSETNDAEWTIRIRLAHVRSICEAANLSTDQEVILCHQTVNVLLDRVIVCGHPMIRSTTLLETNLHTATTVVDHGRQTEIAIAVYGNFLLDSTCLPGIDWFRCTSNDIWEVYNTLGVEACTHVLFDQLKQVVGFDGTYVDDRHLLMIADTMCRNGDIMPLNRHGLRKTDISPLMRCSFEETTDVLCHAAMFAETENAKGVTASIMMGQLTGLGTGTVSVRFPCEAPPVVGTETKRILRSTCRSHCTPTNLEIMEYTTDTAARHQSQRSYTSDVCERARFRPMSPEMDD